MKIQLTDILAIETTLKGQLYKATSPEAILSGQILAYENHLITPVQCQKTSDQWQLLLHSTKQLDASIITNIKGKGLHWQPDEAMLILSEGIGNYLCLHWLNGLRQQSEKSLSAQISRVLMHETEQFAFRPTPSKFLTPDLPGQMIAALPLLDDIGVVSRLCCDEFLPGAYEGSLVALFKNETIKPQAWCGFVSEKTYSQLTVIIGEPTNWFNLDTL